MRTHFGPAFDRFLYLQLRFIGIATASDLHPLAGLAILSGAQKMLFCSRVITGRSV
jgi:hypothetical protein